MGEMLGITLDCIDVSEDKIENGTASIFIEKELQRVKRDVFEKLNQRDVLFVFPRCLSGGNTVLVLKEPKTETSKRRVYLPKTVAKMVLNFSSKPEDLIVLIGPAISKCCYEVSEEVRDTLLSTVKNTKGLYEGRNVDLKHINARQLEEIGVKNIDICSFCTSCNNDMFYSYRKENGTKDRHFAILKLLNTEKEVKQAR